MNYRYIFSSGFSFNNDFWKNLSPLFVFGKNVFFLDELQQAEFDRGAKCVGIGHSLGFLKLNRSGINFDYLIGLQGFLNFCGNSTKMRTVREKSLRKVVESFKTDHNLALSNFHKICGCELSKNMTKEKLLGDLEMMHSAYEHCGSKTLIICSKGDKIVPMSLIADNFSKIPNVSILQIDRGGHSLGFHLAMEVFDIIKRFIENHEKF